MTNIITLARTEAAAASGRNKADAAWRSAWWDLTLALGELPKPGSGDKVAEVAEIIGQSVVGVRTRRAIGARVCNLGITNVGTLPPRMIQAIPVGQFTAETVELAREAEAEGMSLREFSSMLTGKAWADTPEGASPETLVKALNAASPTVIAAVMADVTDKAFEDINEAIVAVTAEPEPAVITPTGVTAPRPAPSPAKVASVHNAAAKVERREIEAAIERVKRKGPSALPPKPDGWVTPAREFFNKLQAADQLWNTELVKHHLQSVLDAVLNHPGPLSTVSEEFVIERLDQFDALTGGIRSAIEAKKGSTVPDTVPDNWG